MDADRAPSNEDLLIRVAAGDRVAFRALYDRTAPRLNAIALRLSRRADLAADALQECYLRIWRKAGKFDPERGTALPWMATILRNTVLDRMPSERPYEDIADVEIAVPPAEPTEVRLDACLARLSEVHRKAVLLVYYDGLTHTEVAEKLAVPLGTAKSWVRRGIEALKSCLEAGQVGKS
jgi:RNA polymerase sigma-70 factor (ECF subfamily)